MASAMAADDTRVSPLSPYAYPLSRVVLPVGTGRSSASSVAWSDEGQALVVASDALHIFTPRVGYAVDATSVGDAVGARSAACDAQLRVFHTHDQSL